MARVIGILIALAIIISGVFQWESANFNARGINPAPAVIDIPPGTGIGAIGERLETAHLVKHGLLFRIGVFKRGMAGRLKAGEYAIPARASMNDIAAILMSGKSVQHKITAAEGLTARMIRDIVAKDPVLAGDAGPVPPEGSLLPETYLFTRGTTRAAMIARMKAAREKYLAAEWPRRAPDMPLGRADAITLASIVEKETALASERPHVAGIFLNRLRIGMRLQTDPAVIYGITQGYPLGRGIRASELAAPTPYNTYVVAGLPPTPIANPGKASIHAVLHPMKTDDLYFVANGKGGHAFAATVAEQNRNVAAWRRIEQGVAPDVAAAEAAKASAKPAPPSARKPARRRARH